MLLIISGGAGNLYDRIFCDGEVRDFIQYMFLDKIWQPLFDSNFGVGNIADIYLVLGVFMICVYIVFDYKEGDLGIFKPKAPKNMRTDEVPVEDASEGITDAPVEESVSSGESAEQSGEVCEDSELLQADGQETKPRQAKRRKAETAVKTQVKD